MAGRIASLRSRTRLPDPASAARRGALLYVAAGIVFVTTDSLTKALVADLPVVHVVFGRNVSYLAAMMVVAGGRRPGRLLATRRPWMQLARGLAMFATTATFFLGLSLLPFAEVNTLASTTPLIVVALAGPLLGERVTRAAVAGAVVGFGGVVVLVGLDPSHLDPAVLVPLASAFSFAVFSMLTRSLRAEPPDVTLFWSGLVSLVASTVLEVAVPTVAAPTPVEWAGIAVVGVLALTGHRLLVAAYRWGRASDMAPLGYLQVAWSFIVGALVFGEPAQVRAVAGAAAIVTGGVVALRSVPPDEEPVAATVDYGGPVEPGGDERGAPSR